MIDENKDFLYMTLLIIFITSFLFGIACQSENKNCTYDSILSRINVGYILGCELSRPRWGKEN